MPRGRSNAVRVGSARRENPRAQRTVRTPRGQTSTTTILAPPRCQPGRTPGHAAIMTFQPRRHYFSTGAEMHPAIHRRMCWSHAISAAVRMSAGGGRLLRMTTAPLDHVRTDLGALLEAWTDAQPAFAGAGSGERAFDELTGPGLVRVIERAAQVKRSLDAFLARAVDAVAAQSGAEFGTDGLAKQHGHSSPVRLVAAATGGAPAEASRLIAVGAATRRRRSFAGEELPAKFEHVRTALDAGGLSIEAAGLITGMRPRRAGSRARPAASLRAEPRRGRDRSAALARRTSGQTRGSQARRGPARSRRCTNVR